MSSPTTPSSPIAPGTKRPSFFRRQFIINGKFQHYFIAFLFVICISVLLVDSLLGEILLGRFEAYLQMAGVDPRILEAGQSSIQSLFLEFIGIVVFSMVLVCGVCGLFVSQKIAGPIFRTLRVLDQLARGEKVQVPVRLRDQDCFPELEGALNILVNRLQPGSDDPEKAIQEKSSAVS